MTTTQTWHHLVYGKLVQSVGGPIVRGQDYRVTGQSPDFPPDLAARLRPREFGLGTTDRFEWSSYKWDAAGGGFIIRPAHADGRDWVVVGRLRGRPEEGEGTNSRRYVQAVYLATLASTWHPGALPELALTLRADPMMATDANLPSFTTTGADEQERRPFVLSDLDQLHVRELLRAVMSGQSMCIKDWATPLPEMLDRLSLVYCAIPRAIAWRLSAGAGLAEMYGDVAMAFGQSTFTDGLRIVGTQMSGHESIDRGPGDRYLRWLTQIAAHCRTRGELADAIGKELPELADPSALDPALPWQVAVTAATYPVDDTFALAALEAYLKVGSSSAAPTAFAHSPARMAFHQRRAEAITLLVRNFHPHGWSVLGETLGPTWADAWHSAATDVGGDAETLAWLCGHMAPPAQLTAESVALLRLPVAPRVAGRFRASLDDWLRDAQPRADASALLDAARVDTGWMREWARERAEALYLLALGTFAVAPSPEALARLPDDHPDTPTIRAVFAQRILPLSPDQLAQIVRRLEAHRRHDLLSALCAAPSAVVVHALRLSRLVYPNGDEALVNALSRRPNVIDTANRLVGELTHLGEKPASQVETFLVAAFARHALRAAPFASDVATEIGSPLAELCLGVTPTRTWRTPAEQTRLRTWIITARPDVLQDLWVSIRTNRGKSRRQPIGIVQAWLAALVQRGSAAPTSQPGLDLLQAVMGLPMPPALVVPPSQLPADDLEAVREILRTTAREGDIAALVRSPAELVALAASGGLVGLRPSPPAQAFVAQAAADVLRTVSEASGTSRTRDALHRLGWDVEPIWRLFGNRGPKRLTPVELNLLRVTPDAALACAISGTTVPQDVLDGVPDDLLASCPALARLAPIAIAGTAFHTRLTWSLLDRVARLQASDREPLELVLTASEAGRSAQSRRPRGSDFGHSLTAFRSRPHSGPSDAELNLAETPEAADVAAAIMLWQALRDALQRDRLAADYLNLVQQR